MKIPKRPFVLVASLSVIWGAAIVADARPEDKAAPPSELARVAPPSNPQ